MLVDLFVIVVLGFPRLHSEELGALCLRDVLEVVHFLHFSFVSSCQEQEPGPTTHNHLDLYDRFSGSSDRVLPQNEYI